ncbi:MAG TPA: hypothetical protein VIG94_02025 [Faecalibacter sp.]
MTNQNNDIERDDLFDRNNLIHPKKEDRNVFHEGDGKSFWFHLMFIMMLFIILSLLYRGYVLYDTNDYLFRSFLNEDAPEMPSWYPITTIGLSILSLIGIVLTYMFKKVGPYLVGSTLFIASAVQPEFMADGTLYTLFALFVFIGYGLAVIFPYWKKFK